MLISEFLLALELVVPLRAVGYDRDAVGLQVGLPEGAELTAALFAYEVTHEVIAEARAKNANLIVAFHPLIFPNVDSITDATRTGTIIRELVKSDIALYIQHTAFDTQPEFGTSILMAEALKLQDIQTLAPDPRLPIPNIGMGAIGKFSKALTKENFFRLVADTFQSSVLRHNSKGPARILRVAVLGGAGMQYYDHARLQEADAFITADVRYHDFHRADHDNILLVDAGHAETERFVTQGAVKAARKALKMNQNALRAVVSLDTLLLRAHSEPNAVRYYGINEAATAANSLAGEQR
jgi:dinuclear metal center YbgI/SA1388 family protein